MDQLIQIIPVLSEEEVRQVNEHRETLELSRSVVLSKGVVDGRTSIERNLDDNHEITKMIHEKMNLALDEYKRRVVKIHWAYNTHPVPGAMNTKSWREDIRIIEYDEGKEYRFHRDSSHNKRHSQYHREISIILYLTDDFEGGETEFLHAKYKPKKGYALIFPSNWCFIHQGCKVTKGVKRIAVTWYYVNSTE